MGQVPNENSRLTVSADEAASPKGAGAPTLETLEGAHRYNAWTYERVREALGNRVLEVGCGTGTITQFLMDRELVVGIDVEPAYVERTRSRFRGQSNVVILVHDLSTISSPDRLLENLPPHLRGRVGVGGGFDSVLSVNVLEHVGDDLAMLMVIHALLDPGGSLTLLVPCHPSLMSPFDRAIGHYRRYTKDELRGKLEAAGFRIERLRISNPVGAIGWFVNNRLLRRKRLRAVGVYDRMVPLLAWVDRWMEPPFGLSLIAIARKPVT
jgi:SAM-dependent methyltransferase